jgi:thiamine-phosphate pyrophosphorylase
MQPHNIDGNRKTHWPKIWLMTDKRNDDNLERALHRLPRKSGVVFRHYHLSEDTRKTRFDQVKKIARRYGHILVLADTPALAKKWGADGIHGRQGLRHRTGKFVHTAPVHDPQEIFIARGAGAEGFFLSPAFPTRSHPDQRPKNALQLRRLIQLCGGPVILLGGMNAKRFHQSHHLGAYGWAAIDALSQ